MQERILCIVGKLMTGGVVSMMHTYYKFLDKSKYQYDFVYEEASDCEVPCEITEMGARIFRVPNISSPIKYSLAIYKIIKEGNYKIVHTNLNTLSVFSLIPACLCGVKYRILHNHSTSSGVEKKRDLIKKILRPFNLWFTNKPCACSELAARWMYGDRAYESGKIKVFRNGVDTERFAFNPEYREEIRKEFNVENKKVIGHLGRFMTQKNHFFIIDIFEKYLEKDKDSILMLVGGGELFESVRKYAADKGIAESIIFTGVRTDADKLYSAFDIFILPSLYEGLPVVAMEACASGLPVILSTEITRECAVTDAVKFLPIDDAAVWADALLEVKPADRNAVAGQMRDGPYNIRNCVSELEKYYDDCI